MSMSMNQFFKRKEVSGRKPRCQESYKYAVNYRLDPNGTTQVRKFKRDCHAVAFMDYLTDVLGVSDDSVTLEGL